MLADSRWTWVQPAQSGQAADLLWQKELATLGWWMVWLAGSRMVSRCAGALTGKMALAAGYGRLTVETVDTPTTFGVGEYKRMHNRIWSGCWSLAVWRMCQVGMMETLTTVGREKCTRRQEQGRRTLMTNSR